MPCGAPRLRRLGQGPGVGSTPRPRPGSASSWFSSSGLHDKVLRYLGETNMLRRALFLSCLLIASAFANAQTFPSKPITLIVPFPAGGVTDPVARLVGAKVSDSTKQPFIVDNRPGAASIIGAELVKRAPADGYTLFFGHFASHCVNPHIYSKLPYDAVKDFAPVTPLISTQSLLVVPLDSPAKSVDELIALAKSKPGGLSYASQGI